MENMYYTVRIATTKESFTQYIHNEIAKCSVFPKDEYPTIRYDWLGIRFFGECSKEWKENKKHWKKNKGHLILSPVESSKANNNGKEVYYFSLRCCDDCRHAPAIWAIQKIFHDWDVEISIRTE